MTDTPLADQIARSLVGGISPGVLPEGEHAAKLEAAREKCRRGNPFPLMAMQWPELVVDDPAEMQFFEPCASGNEPIDDDPCLRIDRWQRLIALAFFDDTIREIYIKGCTGAGKGGIVAMCVCLLYDVNDLLRLSFTGPKFEHTFKGIFGETFQWFKRMRFPQTTGQGTTTIASSQRHYIAIQNPPRGKQGEDFSGQHSQDPRGTWAVFDEASAAEDTWIENAEKNSFKIVALSNPRVVVGYFRQAFLPLGKDENNTGICIGKLGRRLCVTIGGKDCLNVRHNRVKLPVAPPDGIVIDGVQYAPFAPLPAHHFQKVKSLIPGQMDATQFHAACNNPVAAKVRCFAHGMFPDEDPDAQVILSGWLPRHVAEWTQADSGFGVPVNAFGLDVARSLEGDCSCLTAGSGAGIAVQYKEKFATYPEIADWVSRTARERHGIDLFAGNHPICVDITGGYGAGVSDWLRRAGVWVIESNSSWTALVVPSLYQGLRTELYALLGRRLSPLDVYANEPFALPDDPELLADLSAAYRTWSKDLTRFRLMDKHVIAASLGRSPDKGDSAALLFMAVREQEQLNDYFAMTSGDLIAQAGGQEYKAREGVPVPPSRNPKDQLNDLLGWMRERYK